MHGYLGTGKDYRNWKEKNTTLNVDTWRNHRGGRIIWLGNKVQEWMVCINKKRKQEGILHVENARVG